MHTSKLRVRATLLGLALGLIHGCAGTPRDAEEESLTKAVVDSMYTSKVYMTGSRIPRVVDRRKSLESQSPQPLKVIDPR